MSILMVSATIMVAVASFAAFAVPVAMLIVERNRRVASQMRFARLCQAADISEIGADHLIAR